VAVDRKRRQAAVIIVLDADDLTVRVNERDGDESRRIVSGVVRR
jgi:hypothetical protein